MQKQKADIEDFIKIPSVGETKAEILQEAGYDSFEKLSTANPIILHKKCDIVISSAMQIISAAIENVEGMCPDCGSNHIKNEWQEYNNLIPEDEDVDISCGDCNWYGMIDELKY